MCIKCLMKELGLDVGGIDHESEEEEKPKMKNAAEEFKAFMDKVSELKGPGGLPNMKASEVIKAVENAANSQKYVVTIMRLLKKNIRAMETVLEFANSNGATEPANDCKRIISILKTIVANPALVTVISENARIVAQEDKKKYKFEIVQKYGSNGCESDVMVSIEESGSMKGGLDINDIFS